jgi:hypothetical protein
MYAQPSLWSQSRKGGDKTASGTVSFHRDLGPVSVARPSLSHVFFGRMGESGRSPDPSHKLSLDCTFGLGCFPGVNTPLKRRAKFVSQG